MKKVLLFTLCISVGLTHAMQETLQQWKLRMQRGDRKSDLPIVLRLERQYLAELQAELSKYEPGSGLSEAEIRQLTADTQRDIEQAQEKITYLEGRMQEDDDDSDI